MTGMSRLLLRIARWIAGSARADWIDAMAAEAASIDSNSAGWATGCLWAALKDRAARDGLFLLAALLLPVLALLWKGTVFFSTSSLLVHQRIPAWGAVAMWVLSPLPLLLLFTQLRRGTSTYVALAISFVIVEFGPFLFLWIEAGISPVTFFSAQQVNWYKADPNVRIAPVPGITLDMLVWLAGAWLGSNWQGLVRRTPDGG